MFSLWAPQIWSTFSFLSRTASRVLLILWQGRLLPGALWQCGLSWGLTKWEQSGWFFFCLLANKHLSKAISGITDISQFDICLPTFPSFFFPSLLSFFLPFYLLSFLAPLLSSFIFFLSFLPYFLLIYFDFEGVSKILQREVEGTFRHGDRTVCNFHGNSKKKTIWSFSNHCDCG